jgi:hypothetical protein
MAGNSESFVGSNDADKYSGKDSRHQAGLNAGTAASTPSSNCDTCGDSGIFKSHGTNVKKSGHQTYNIT